MKKTKNLFLSCILLILLAGCTRKHQEASITPTTIPEANTPPAVASTDAPSSGVKPATFTPLPTTAVTAPVPAAETPMPSAAPGLEIPSPSLEPTPPTSTILTPTKELSPTKTPTEISSQTPATTTNTPTKKPTPHPTKPPAKLSVSPIPTPDIPAYTDEESEYFKNAWLPSVELSETNFPDEVFRNLISKIVDKNKDGILTLEERETLTYLRDTFYMGDPEDPEPYEPDDTPDDYLMTRLVPDIRDFTGIEYFPQLKTIYRSHETRKKEAWHPINLSNLPNLENFYFKCNNTDSENTHSFNFEHLPKLKNVEIEIKNLDSVSYLSFNDIADLQEFRITGNVASLDGLEQTNVQKMLLKFEKISGKLPFFPREESQLTCDLTEFKSLNELHIYVPENPKTYILRDGTSLETLGLNASGGTVILQHMPKLQDARVFGATAIENEDCPNLELLKTGMSENVECLDLSSFSNLKILEVSWHFMSLPSLILPNDAVDIAIRSGSTQTSITYQEQPVFKKMQQSVQTALEKPATLSGAAIEYEKISEESLSAPGIYEFICTPGHGYQIDLDEDGIDEELYTDSEDFYIDGIGLNISRNNYKNPLNPWEIFWIKVSDDTQTRQLILNTAPLERYYYALYKALGNPPVEYYWSDNDTLGWGEKADMKLSLPNFYIGQFLLSYDGKLHLQAYAEGDFWDYDKESIVYPLVEAEYNAEGISFSNIENQWIRIYGTDTISSLYFQASTW